MPEDKKYLPWLFLGGLVAYTQRERIAKWLGITPAKAAKPPTYKLSVSVVEKASPEKPLPGAEVFLDGEKVGTTDENGRVSIPEVEAGSHDIKANKAGYRPDSKTIKVPETKSVTLTLAPATYTVMVVVTGPKGEEPITGALVLVDGSEIGRTGKMGRLNVHLKAGSHKIEARKEYYKSSSKTVNVTKSMSVGLSLTPQAYRLVVTVKGGKPIQGATVLLDDEKVGRTSPAGKIMIGEVTPGQHTITATKPGYVSDQESVNIPGTRSITLELRKAPPRAEEVQKTEESVGAPTTPSPEAAETKATGETYKSALQQTHLYQQLPEEQRRKIEEQAKREVKQAQEKQELYRALQSELEKKGVSPDETSATIRRMEAEATEHQQKSRLAAARGNAKEAATEATKADEVRKKIQMDRQKAQKAVNEIFTKPPEERTPEEKERLSNAISQWGPALEYPKTVPY